eukprot:7177925-Pyramimonas_sp.AAC.1
MHPLHRPCRLSETACAHTLTGVRRTGVPRPPSQHLHTLAAGGACVEKVETTVFLGSSFCRLQTDTAVS